jgi:hypothetical protein
MAKRKSAWIAWGAAVAVAYAALGIFAYVIGPPPRSLQGVPSCGILGSGSGPTAQADSSSFGVFVLTSPPTGSFTFTDQGPKSPIRLHTARISTVTCAVNASAGTVTGTVDLRAGASHPVGFRIDLTVSEGTERATFRIRLTDGYNSGIETLKSASLEIKTPRHNVTVKV